MHKLWDIITSQMELLMGSQCEPQPATACPTCGCPIAYLDDWRSPRHHSRTNPQSDQDFEAADYPA